MPYCMTEESEYDNIKRLFTQKKVQAPLLEQIKFAFKDEISSPRRYGSIKTLADLIDCLERIDVLSQYNVESLSQIAEYFADDELYLALENYEEPPEQDDGNNYAIQRTNEINNKIGMAHEYVKPKVVQQTFATPEFTERKRNAVYKQIAREIGRNWRSLGRELGVRAGDLDRIEAKHVSDLESRVFAIFEIFESDPTISVKDHFFKICTALDKCRRKDLHRSVEKIMLNDDLL